MCNSFKIRPAHFSCGGKIFLRGLHPWLRACGLPYITKNKHFLAYFIRFSKIRSCKPGCAPASPAAHLQCSTAVFDETLAQPDFCSCKLLSCSDECVSLPCFNAQPDIFAVMNCCVVALSLFFSDCLTWSADSLYSVDVLQRHIVYSARCLETTHTIKGVDVEKCAYYVNKLRQNVGLETWKWRQIVTSQTAHTKYKWPPYDPERKLPPWKFSAYATDQGHI